MSDEPGWTLANRPTLWFLSQGDAVEQLQRLLEKAGFYSAAEGDEPGFFGSNTEAAVRGFQGARDLTVTGVADDRVWMELAEHDDGSA